MVVELLSSADREADKINKPFASFARNSATSHMLAHATHRPVLTAFRKLDELDEINIYGTSIAWSFLKISMDNWNNLRIWVVCLLLKLLRVYRNSQSQRRV
jgi:hypothetical protein